jgi:hypothetical protein
MRRSTARARHYHCGEFGIGFRFNCMLRQAPNLHSLCGRNEDSTERVTGLSRSTHAGSKDMSVDSRRSLIKLLAVRDAIECNLRPRILSELRGHTQQDGVFSKFSIDRVHHPRDVLSAPFFWRGRPIEQRR